MCEDCGDTNRDHHIVANQMKLPSGKIIRSHDRHDYVSVVEDGVTYMVDGGDAYLRRSLTGLDCSVYSDDPFDLVREYLAWGTYGKDGKQPFKRVMLSEMTNAHIEAVLETQAQVPVWRRALMIEELSYRKAEGIVVED
jgi:hypothetical protein